MVGFGKRGEMTTQQIVTLVILIASFGVLLYFFANLGLGEKNESEICHNSVVTRGASVVPTDSVPLDCKRSYVCLSKDGSCEKMSKPRVEKVRNKDDVYNVLAEELVNCWWMYGEGKINYVGKDLTHNLYCSMCSQIAFDDSLHDVFERGEINRTEFFYYLTSMNKTDEGETYSMYLYGTNDIEKVVQLDSEYSKITNLKLDSQYYVLTAITSKITTLGWIASGAAAIGTAAGVIFGGPIAWVSGIIVGGTSGHFIGNFVRGESGNDYISPTLVEVGSEDFRALNCDEVVTAA